MRRSAESHACLPQIGGDAVAEFVEGTRDNEEDVARVQRLLARLALALKLHRGLELRLQVVLAAKRHLGFLHELEQRGLHATPAHVPAMLVAGGRDLVDLVDVDDAILRQREIAVGLLCELTHEVVHVATHIAGLAEFRRIRLYKRHADQLSDMLHEVRLTHAGRADEDDVLLRVFDLCRLLGRHRGELPRVVVMVAHRNRESLLGVVLTDDIAIEMALDVTRSEGEIENLPGVRDLGLFGSSGVRLRLGLRGEPAL